MSEPSSTTVTEPERREPLGGLMLADREFLSLQRRAGALFRSQFIRNRLPKDATADDALVIMVRGVEYGLEPTRAFEHLYPIAGTIVASAQLQTGLARAAGHKIIVTELTRERCVVKGRRKDSAEWLTIEYTAEGDARDAGLLDEWVEKWVKKGENWKLEEKFVLNQPPVMGVEIEVPEWAKKQIAAGKIKRRDNWWKFRKDMLRARGTSMLCRSLFQDALLGFNLDLDEVEEIDDVWTPEVDRHDNDAEHRYDPGPDEDIVDADIVVDADDHETAGGVDQGDGESSGLTADAAANNAADPASATQGPLYDPDDPERPFEAA